MRLAADGAGTESGTCFPLRRESLSSGLPLRLLTLALADVIRGEMGITQPSSQ